MTSKHNVLTLTFTILLLSTLFVLSIKPTNAQAISKPSVPQFTLKLVDNSYDVPSLTTTTIDQYTGQESTYTRPGYHVENRTIEIKIRNQPFTPSTAENGQKRELLYNVRVKGHFGEEWTNCFTETSLSDTQYAVLTFPAQNYAVGAQLDFQVEAIIGHIYDPMPDRLIFIMAFMTEASSGWSNTQQFTIPDISQPSTSPSQTTMPTNPTATPNNNYPQQSEQTQPPSFVFNSSFLLWLVTFLFVVVTVTVVLIFFRRQLKTLNHNSPNSAESKPKTNKNSTHFAKNFTSKIPNNC
ncbi:MAG: hypothetical protein FWH37_03830 [Candidatus Bathyarchaeota archaeon]|nr:hypothetical protein [Candidatus Termiticorpusculum sp.]